MKAAASAREIQGTARFGSGSGPDENTSAFDQIPWHRSRLGRGHMKYRRLFQLLTSYPGHDSAFNQYRDFRPSLDQPDGPAIRCQNLRSYLQTFDQASGVRYLLVGEAAGYAGCRFSGIPFTGEAQLVGPDRLPWTEGKGLARSSLAGNPWAERSAKMVWEALADRRDCVLWNAFPWHPMGSTGPLSNRAPGADLQHGYQVLRSFLVLYPQAQPCAIGRVAQRSLAAIGVEAPYIRHPSRGGKAKFLAGVAALSPGTSASPVYQG